MRLVLLNLRPAAGRDLPESFWLQPTGLRSRFRSGERGAGISLINYRMRLRSCIRAVVRPGLPLNESKASRVIVEDQASSADQRYDGGVETFTC